MLVRNVAVCIASVLALFHALPSQAATIKYAGSTSKVEEATHWRTATVKKTLDLDGDNIYGTMGAVIWTHGSAGEQKAGSTSLGWVFAGGASQYVHPEYAIVDDQSDATKRAPAGIMVKNFDFQLVGVPSDYDGKTVRVGIIEDVLGKDENPADIFKALQVIQTTGAGNGDSGVQLLRGGSAGTGSPIIYFFDITQVKPGDTFSIKALSNQGGKSGNAGYVGPICWDIRNNNAK